MTDVAEALKGLTKRQMEKLAATIEKELRTCILCGAEGAEPYRIRRVTHGAGDQAAMLFCRPCFEKHRIPESRAAVTA